jgi:hypothetical protein
MFRSRLVLLLAAVLLLLPGALVAPAQAAARPSCGTTWGSQPKTFDTGPSHRDVLVKARSGRHACYDRLVVDIADAGGGYSYDVRYVRHVLGEGSGEVVPLRGGAALQIVLGVPAYNDEGQSTFNPPSTSEVVDVKGYRTFRQVASAGSFEGQSILGLGVRARLPFRVSTLPGGVGTGLDVRIVVDVAHRW